VETVLEKRKIVVPLIVGVWEHTDSWLKAKIDANLELNTNA